MGIRNYFSFDHLRRHFKIFSVVGVKIGVVGTGHLGEIHIKCLGKTDFDLVGCYDINKERVRTVSESYHIKSYDDIDDLISDTDAIIIVSTTKTHYEIAHKVISRGKHAFIEKPFVETTEQGKILLALANEKKVKVQLGHVERYNPVVKSIERSGLQPKFIEAHRLAMFNPRGNDVSVVMDLMIHDLDLLAYFVKGEVTSIVANGVNVVENSPDICSARINFDNGCVANLTASRISLKQMRKFRVFQEDKYISLDFLNKETQVVSLSETSSDPSNQMSIETMMGKKYISIESPEIIPNNAIVEELKDFHSAIADNTSTSVTIKDGLKSLEMAEEIQECIFINNQKSS